MNSTRPISSLILILFFLLGVAPLFADHVEIGGHGDFSLDRPFCGS